MSRRRRRRCLSLSLCLSFFPHSSPTRGVQHGERGHSVLIECRTVAVAAVAHGGTTAKGNGLRGLSDVAVQHSFHSISPLLSLSLPELRQTASRRDRRREEKEEDEEEAE